MLVIDIILIVILVGFFVYGWQTGLVKAIGGLIGVVFGIILSGRYYQFVADFVLPYLKGNENLAKVVGYLAVFAAVNIVVMLIASVVTGIFKLIPFMTGLNRLSGAVLMLLVGGLAIGFILLIISSLPFSETISKYSQGSMLVPWVEKIFNLLSPLIPASLEQAKKIIKKPLEI